MKQIRILLAATCIFATFAVLAATPEPAGQVQFAAGTVDIISADNISRPAVKGGVINERDTIVTGANGAAHLRMADDGVIALRAASRITIEQFRWQGKADGTERSVVGLFKGGFRTITGAIGRRDKNSYIVNTPTATIGIRGTDHEPFYIAEPEAGEVAAGQPGTYNKVNVGETFIRSPAGLVELGANEVGFASLQPNVSPVKLDRIPNFMRRAAAPTGKPNLRNLREVAGFDARQERLAALRNANDERRDARPLRLPALRHETAQSGFDIGTQRGGLHVAPDGTGLVGGMTFDFGGNVAGDSGAVLVPGSKDNIVILDRSNNPFIISNDTGFKYARLLAPLVDSGQAVVDSTPIRWGVYQGGAAFTQARGDLPANYTHFMLVPAVTPLAVLTGGGGRTYSMVAGGFTLPVDEQNRIGGAVTLFNAQVTFGATPTLDTYNINVTDAGGRAWTGSLTTPITLRNWARSGGGANMGGTCTGGGCPGAVAGETSGFIIGPSANGLISSYRLQATAGGPQLVTGSVAGKSP